jgi:hypothetical protein
MAGENLKVVGSSRTVVRTAELATCKIARRFDGTVTATFRATVPDARCRIRVAIFQEAIGGTYNQSYMGADRFGPTMTAWVCLCMRTASGNILPIQDLIGTGAAPLAIPVNLKLWGHSDEIETVGNPDDSSASKEIRGIVAITGENSGADPYEMKWYVEITYQAYQGMTDAEWSRVVAQAGCSGPDKDVIGNEALP